MNPAPRIMLSAGEASGDRLGAGLARALRRRRPDVQLIGMGGDEMAAAGVRLIRHASEVAVMGLFEVVRHLPALRRTMSRLEQALRVERPDLLVPVDFPDFNLRLSARATRAGVPVVYFVSPQLWAWRRGRVKRMRSWIRRMLVLFPFETRFYEAAGIPATFVGHPAVETVPFRVDREELAARIGLDPAVDIAILMPGSRVQEVSRILPVLLRAAAEIQRRRPKTQFLIPRARTLPPGFLEARVRNSGLEHTTVHRGDYPELLGIGDVGAVTSGTATLEAALSGLPLVVVYRLGRLSFQLARRLVALEHVALPNLVVGRPIVRELMQHDCTADRVAAELLALLEEPARREAIRAGLSEVRRQLGAPGAFDRAARAVLAELDAAGRPIEGVLP